MKKLWAEFVDNGIILSVWAGDGSPAEVTKVAITNDQAKVIFAELLDKYSPVKKP